MSEKSKPTHNNHRTETSVESLQGVNVANAGQIETVIFQNSTDKTLKDFTRILFSLLTGLALIWVAMHFFLEFDSMPMEKRGEVAAANAWMLLPVALLMMPVFFLSNVCSTSFMAIREIINPDQLGAITIFFLVICSCLVILWLLAADSHSKKLFADGIKTMLGATIGAALEHRAKNTSGPKSQRDNSRSLTGQ